MSWIICLLFLSLIYFLVYYLIPKTSHYVRDSQREAEISENISKIIDISTTQKFRDLIKNEFSESSKAVRADYQNDGHYINNCWACLSAIDSYYCYRCPICGWYKCGFCGTCGRGCSARGVYTEHLFNRIASCSDECLEKIRQFAVNSNSLNQPLTVLERLLQLKRYSLPYKEIAQLLDIDGYGEQKLNRDMTDQEKKDRITADNEIKATRADIFPGSVLYHKTLGKCTVVSVNDTNERANNGKHVIDANEKTFSAEFSDGTVREFIINSKVGSFLCKDKIIWHPTLCIGDELWNDRYGLGEIYEISPSYITVNYIYQLVTNTYSSSQLRYSFPDLRNNPHCPNGNRKIFDEP